jgi:hypothetical protein
MLAGSQILLRQNFRGTGRTATVYPAIARHAVRAAGVVYVSCNAPKRPADEP